MRIQLSSNRECVDNNYSKDACHLTTIILHLSSGKTVQKKFRKMFSKFKIEKPQHVLYRQGPRHFEAEQTIVSLPLLEVCDAHFCNLLAENDQLRTNNVMKDVEVAKKRAGIFQLTQELQLLREDR